MDLRDVHTMATSLLRAHGLGTWHVGWDNARRRAGMCRYHTRTISLSRPLMALYDADQVREVLLHEIAHALVGPEHHHDAVWRAKARELGGTGRRALPAETPRPPAPWLGRCPRGHEFPRYRLPRGSASCSVCSPRFDARFLIEWRRVR